MNATLDIKCPKCALPLRLQRPSSPSEVACPKCGNRFGLTTDGAITSVSKREIFDELPNAVVADAAPKRPKGFKSRQEPPGRKPTIEAKSPAGTFHAPLSPLGPPKSSLAWVKTAWIPLSCIAATLLAGILVYVNRDSLPLESIVPIKSIVAAIPLMDSHEKVLDDYRHVAETSVEVIVALRSRPTDTDADAIMSTTKMVDQLTRKCNEIRRRAAALPPTTPENWASLIEWFNGRLSQSRQELDTAVDDTPMRTQLRLTHAPAFRTSCAKLMLAMQDVRGTIETGWQPLPKPTNASDSVEYEALMAKRNIWQALMTAESESDYRAIPKVYEASTRTIDQLVSKLESGGGSSVQFRAISPYFGASVTYGSEIAFATHDLEEKYGPWSDPAPISKFTAAVDRLNALARAPSTPLGDSTSQPRSPAGPHNPAMGTVPAMGTGPAYKDVNQWADATIKFARSAHPTDEIILVRVDGKSDGQAGQWSESLKKKLSLDRSLQFGFQNSSIVVLFDSGAVQRVADAIVGADVLSIDGDQRLIHVRLRG